MTTARCTAEILRLALGRTSTLFSCLIPSSFFGFKAYEFWMWFWSRIYARQVCLPGSVSHSNCWYQCRNAEFGMSQHSGTFRILVLTNIMAKFRCGCHTECPSRQILPRPFCLLFVCHEEQSPTRLALHLFCPYEMCCFAWGYGESPTCPTRLQRLFHFATRQETRSQQWNQPLSSGSHWVECLYIQMYSVHHTSLLIKGSLDEKLPSYEVLKMLRE